MSNQAQWGDVEESIIYTSIAYDPKEHEHKFFLFAQFHTKHHHHRRTA